MKCIIKILTTTAIALGFAASAQATPYAGADIELLGKEYSDIYSIDTAAKDWTTLSDGSIYTAWARQWVEYSAYLDIGTWNIGINATNHGNITEDWYSQFNVLFDGVGEYWTFGIAASDNEVNYGYLTADVETAGYYTVRYTWGNDAWAPSQGLDANIQITSVFFDNTATTAPVPEPATMLLFGVGLAGLAGFTKRNRK